MTDTSLAPVARRDRIDVLDMLRGIAILGIFYMNIPFMGNSGSMQENDIRSIGWSGADQTVWSIISIVAEGTQRGLLEMLFGAGMMVLAARAMEPDGPVAVADLYLRRNIWLLAFGLFDVFVLGWVGDILHTYAIAALFLFPFRTLKPRTLVALGLVYPLALAAASVGEYVSRGDLIAKVEAIHVKRAAKQPLTAENTKTLAEWQKKLDRFKVDAEEKKDIDAEAQAHKPGTSVFDYIGAASGFWLKLLSEFTQFFWIVEAFATMLIGIALWKWRIIQGGRTARFYLVMMLAAYGFGFTARAIGVAEITTFSPIPKTIWMTGEFARLAVTLGHVALINLAVKSAIGAGLFAPFKAAGRMAFSLYFMQQIIGLWILFAPWGFGLWGRYGHAELAGIATLVILGQLIFANIWMRFFVAGPLEWLWRSLAYVEWQPFLAAHRRGALPDPA
ncbi:DUF418 domain-containing protein [Sphingomonas sp. SUN039]|uniref:DUF418 domain-containing protein n=1 Tax=Sphingomonas sp. SUN039 TaxID=2937787 RepID=UPI0021641AAF|nr:DUF418 domain-containing protein [Sphingomonas sp. SUN039]UVO53812.1 DUF418 domain-containing protein [Sphingomonas sp. SUN039]